MIGSRAPSSRRSAVRLLPGRAERRAARSAGRPSTWPTAPRCAARYAELRAFMDALRAEADAEADDVFTRRAPARPAAADRPPHRARRPLGARHQLSRPHRGHPAHADARLAHGAALAGGRRRRRLFVGVGVGGMFFDSRRDARGAGQARRSSTASQRRLASTPTGRQRRCRIDRSTTTRSCRSSKSRSIARARAELAAFDALTPHVREISLAAGVR